ncbi:MAG: hypothetical protein IPG71_00575 [bacterium]|nr:hypothetical protein [bacterium]
MRHNILAFCTLPLLIVIGACEEEPTEPTVGNPTITILNPGAGGELSGLITVEVFAHDASGDALDRIVYFIDETAMYTDPNPTASSPSSTWQWNSGDVPDGDYVLRVVGYDNVGRSSETTLSAEISNADAASGAIRSNESGVIRTRNGAQIRVPLGAVPLAENGQTATMVFSVDRDSSTNAAPPSGQTRVSNYYRFTPGGFVFAYPVELTLPLLDGADISDREVFLYRINPTSGQLENFAGTFDEEFGTVSAQTYELSIWFAAASITPGVNSEGWGCIEVESASDELVTLCVETYLLHYPSADQVFLPEHGLHSICGSGQFGLSETAYWYLPQGTYTICMQRRDNNGDIRRQARQMTIAQPAGRLWDGTMTCAAAWSGFSSEGGAPEPVIGTCGCVPEATIPVGTGEVQVTLQWFNENNLDLDLWVYEPSGERCYFGHSETATGGQLDRDNLCGNYQNGTPENIFWQTAPVGEYSVWVDWWSDCGNNIPQQPLNIRVVNRASVETYDRIIGHEQSIEIVQFQVLPGGFIRTAPPGALFHAEPPPQILVKETPVVSQR